MILHVQYKNFNYDWVDASFLDRLLSDKALRLFYRPSEERWVNVSRDLVRGAGGNYSGPNRRIPHKTQQKHKSSATNQAVGEATGSAVTSESEESAT